MEKPPPPHIFTEIKRATFSKRLKAAKAISRPEEQTGTSKGQEGLGERE